MPAAYPRQIGGGATKGDTPKVLATRVAFAYHRSEMPGHDDRDDDRGAVVVAVQRGAIAEVRRDVEDLRDDTGRIERQVERHERTIDDLSQRQARIEGEVSHLTRAYERAATVATTQVLADLEIKKADALDLIKQRSLDKKHSRAVRREVIFKAIALGGGGVALLYSLLQTRC